MFFTSGSRASEGQREKPSPLGRLRSIMVSKLFVCLLEGLNKSRKKRIIRLGMRVVPRFLALRQYTPELHS